VLNNATSVELKKFQSIYPQNVEVFTTDKYGSILSATGRTSDYYQADEEWWQKAWNNTRGAIYISAPTFDESAKTYTIDIALPITGQGSSQPIGVLHTTINISRYIAVIGAAQIGETGRTDLIFQNKQILSAGTAGLITPDSKTATAISALTETYQQVDYEGTPSLIIKTDVTAPLSQYGEAIDQLNWSVVTHQDLAETQAPVAVTTRTNLVTAIISAILMGLVAIGISQLIAYPLTRLTSVAKQVSAGDLTTKAMIESEDEFGVLAVAFNIMISPDARIDRHTGTSRSRTYCENGAPQPGPCARHGNRPDGIPGG
jgi:methyl-accepting chemotaxis protein